MRRYRFRLAPVLRVRRIEEDRAAGELALAQLDERRAEEELAARRTAYSVLPVRDTGTEGVATFTASRFRYETAAAGIAAAEAHRSLVEAAAAERRAAYLAAAARRTALERLDERKREEHRLETDRDEAVEVDDVVTGRFARRGEQR